MNTQCQRKHIVGSNQKSCNISSKFNVICTPSPAASPSPSSQETIHWGCLCSITQPRPYWPTPHVHNGE